MTQHDDGVAIAFRWATEQPEGAVTFESVRGRVTRHRRRITGGALAAVMIVVTSAVAAVNMSSNSSPQPTSPSVSTSRSVSSSPVASQPAQADPRSLWLSVASRAKVDGLCAPYVAYERQHPFPYPTFDPMAPAKNALPGIGRYGASLHRDTLVAALNRVQLTDPNRAQWKRVLQLLNTRRSIGDQEIAAENGGDVRRFSTLIAVVNKVQPGLDEAWAAAGFFPSDACYWYFS